MKALDVRNNVISEGSQVRYAGTGTIGEVVGIKTKDDEIWAKIDATKLWYNTKYLEVIEGAEEEKKELKKLEIKDIEEKIKKMEKDIEKAAEVASSELCDGGG